MSYHGQFGEDQIAQESGLLPTIGVFVDVGAGHWRELSNTLHFEESGWSGLLIEADPRRIVELRANRKATVEHCAIAPTGTLTLADNMDLTTTGGHLPTDCQQIEVPHATLETLLCKHGIGKIDLLSIDVEGGEEFVWGSFEPCLHAPSVVIIEFYTIGTPSKLEAIREMMERTGEYRLIATTNANLVYARLGAASPSDNALLS